MNHLTKALENARREFEKLVVHKAWHESSCPAHSNQMRPENECNCIYDFIQDEIVASFSSSHLAILEALEKDMEGKKRRIVTEPAENERSDVNVWKTGYNTAIQDLLAFITDAKKNL